MQLNTLDSIARLFAIVADKDIELSNEQYTKVFVEFLRNIVEDRYVEVIAEKYLSYLSDAATGSSLKKMSLQSVRLISILEDIKSKLSKTDRLMVAVYIVMLSVETGISKSVNDFINEIFASFSINIDIINDVLDFISSTSNNSIAAEEVNKVLKHNLYYVGEGLILFKTNNPNFKLNGLVLKSKSVYVISKDSVLSTTSGRNYYYPELESLCKTIAVDCKFRLIISDLEYKKKNKTLVNKISLDIDGAQLVAVIGNSGSGKTSFLNCISGYESKFSGKVFFDKEDKSPIVKAFVPQENSFVPNLSVEEHILERCRYLNFDKEKSKLKSAEVLNIAGLNDIRNNKVCKTDFTADEISGGQQKRLAIATELLADPDFLVLDEPTSGLSSQDSYDIIKTLKELSIAGKLVIASVHQPDFDVFMLFDKVLVFGDNGFPVYFGSPSSTADYFREAYDRVDINSDFASNKKTSVILNLISNEKNNQQPKTKISELYARFRNDNQSKSIVKSEVSADKFAFNPLSSFIYFLRFGFKVDIKHKARLFLTFFIPLIAGVVLSFVSRYSHGEEYVYFYNPNIPVWLLMILITSIFVGLAGAGHEFIYLRTFYESLYRLSENRYARTFAVILRFAVISLLQSVLLVLPSVIIIQNCFHFVSIFIFSFILCFWGSIIGLLLSAIMKSTLTVYLFIPLIIIPQLVYSGALIKFDDFNKIIKPKSDVPILASVVPMRWAAEALLLDFYINNPYHSKQYNNRCELYNAIYYSEFFIPKILEIQKSDSIKAICYLKLEESSLGFIKKDSYSNVELVNLIKQYNSIKINCLENEREILKTFSNPLESKLKYSNLAVNNIVDGFSSGEIFIKENEICRKYKSAYNLPEKKKSQYFYMSAVRNFGISSIATINYNFLVICMLTLINISVLFLIVSNKRIINRIK